MVIAEDLRQFLARNHISEARWQQSRSSWVELTALRSDYEARLDGLREVAELLARVLQKFPAVHSVRWRLKEPDHLLEKIVRKRADGSEKYSSINLGNYLDIVTDLVGVRALHLFKDDFLEIDRSLQEKWTPLERPIAYIREGDSQQLQADFRARGFDVQLHSAGYRSVHYLIGSQLFQARTTAEIQVRTIFEEGWSEIDHRVRYPYFKDNELVNYFLTIFNRLAGSADEMGGFVNGLAVTLQELQRQLEAERNKSEESFRAMEAALAQLESSKASDSAAQESVSTLKSQIKTLKQAPAFEQRVARYYAGELSKVLTSEGSALAKIIGDQDSSAKLRAILSSIDKSDKNSP